MITSKLCIILNKHLPTAPPVAACSGQVLLAHLCRRLPGSLDVQEDGVACPARVQLHELPPQPEKGSHAHVQTACGPLQWKSDAHCSHTTTRRATQRMLMSADGACTCWSITAQPKRVYASSSAFLPACQRSTRTGHCRPCRRPRERGCGPPDGPGRCSLLCLLHVGTLLSTWHGRGSSKVQQDGGTRYIWCGASWHRPRSVWRVQDMFLHR